MAASADLPKISTFTNVMMLSNFGALGLTYASKLPQTALAGPAINLIGLGITGVMAMAGDKPAEASRAGLLTSAISLVPTVVAWRSTRSPVMLNSVALTGISCAFYAAKFGSDAKE